MTALQCPRCQLRFVTGAELRSHLEVDHPSFHAGATTVDEDLLGACHCHHHPGQQGHHGSATPGATAAA